MAEIQKDPLLALIQSLSKSEKRQFRLFVNRLGINTDAKFLLLFDVLDKMSEYDEKKILERKITTKQQLSNLKAHLYKQILFSLKMNPSNMNNRILLREQMDFATILYNKGLYKQSLKILDKTKQTAIDLEEKDIAYEIVEFEKVIESQYITRSIASRADDLIADAKRLGKVNALNSKLSNLSLKLFSMMLSNGFAKNNQDKSRIQHFFDSQMPKTDLHLMGFREKLWFYKAHVWKYLLLQDHINAYKYSLQWVDLFYSHPEMIVNHPVWFLKGNSYLLNTLFLLRKRKRFEFWLNKLEQIVDEKLPKNENIESVLFTVLFNARMNRVFLTGNYQESEILIQQINADNAFQDFKVDEHHILILHFKIASAYMGNREYDKCLNELFQIIYHKKTAVKDDLLFNSRLLAIMVMIDSGMDENLDEFMEESQKFFKKMKLATDFHHLTIKAFSEISEAYASDRKKLAEKYLKQYLHMQENPFNSRDFVYLDVISWLESIIQNKAIGEVIRDKSV